MELDLARQSEQDRYENRKEKYKALPELLEDIERKHAENLKDIDKNSRNHDFSCRTMRKLTNLYHPKPKTLKNAG